MCVYIRIQIDCFENLKMRRDNGGWDAMQSIITRSSRWYEIISRCRSLCHQRTIRETVVTAVCPRADKGPSSIKSRYYRRKCKDGINRTSISQT